MIYSTSNAAYKLSVLKYPEQGTTNFFTYSEASMKSLNRSYLLKYNCGSFDDHRLPGEYNLQVCETSRAIQSFKTSINSIKD